MTGVTQRPLTGVLHRNADYYGMEWLPDGYPGRRQGDRLWAHPLYGAYVLKDYLDQLERQPDESLRDAVRSVATASLARMDRHHGALVFWYEKTTENSRSLERHYSGLTQGYYAVQLARAGRALRDSGLTRAAESTFASLTIPADQGGVYSRGVSGPSIAEVSQQPTSYILNGWQSSLVAILEYAEVTGARDARQLANDSAAEMARLLPLYDAPVVRNSRYGLSGFVYARLIFRGADSSGLAVRRTRLVVPGDAARPVESIGGRRWENHVLPQDVRDDSGAVLRPVGQIIRLNVVLSRVSFPAVNRLVCEVEGPGGVVDVQLQQGRYDPLTVSQTERSWVTIARVNCEPGASRVDVALPWDVADLVAYPTNFTKVIDGHHTNVYHLTHISRLRELAAATSIAELAEWADTWHRYLGTWSDMELYAGMHVMSGSRSIPLADVQRMLPPAVASPVIS